MSIYVDDLISRLYEGDQAVIKQVENILHKMDQNIDRINRKVTDFLETFFSLLKEVPLENHQVLDYLVSKDLIEVNFYEIKKHYEMIKLDDVSTFYRFKDSIYSGVILKFNCSPENKESIDELVEVLLNWLENVLYSSQNVVQATKAAFLGISNLGEKYGLSTKMTEQSNFLFDLVLSILGPLYTHSDVLWESTSYKNNKRIFSELKPTLRQIHGNISSITIMREHGVDNLPMDELMDIGDNVIDSAESRLLKEQIDNIKKACSNIFSIVEQSCGEDKLAPSYYVFKESLLEWTSLPSNINTENILEYGQLFVRNLLNTFGRLYSREFLTSQRLFRFLQEFDVILNSLDSGSVKFLLTLKHNNKIHDIKVPNILEEDEDHKLDQGVQSYASDFVAASDSTGESVVYTFSNLFDIICFHKDKGAISRLSSKNKEAFFDLYYSGLLNYITSSFFDEFDFKLIKHHFLSELRIFDELIMNRNGVTLNNFLLKIYQLIIDNFKGAIEKLERILQNGIRKMLNLGKMFVEFLQNVDLPEEIKNVLGKYPLFEKLDKDTSILHVFVAIPLVLYQKYFTDDLFDLGITDSL